MALEAVRHLRPGLLGLAMALCLPCGPALADSFADASRAYLTGDFAHARKIWLSLADAGNAESAYRLGLLSDLGQGAPENAGDAYAWYRRAAEGGNAAAEFNVAVMEDSGRGTAHDAADAATWYGRAAARGNSRAQYNLGLLYQAGDGVPQNPAAAQAWFRLARAGGLQAADAKLAGLDTGTGKDDGAELQSAVPSAPRAGAIVTPGADGSTEIVWRAPRQRQAVRYFLQVVKRQGGATREVQGGYVDATAALVHLDPMAHSYFWRIFTVSPGRARYSVTPWIAFSLRALA